MSLSLRFNQDISLQRFVDEYWQQRPLLLRQAIDPNLLTFPADELAGLACEEGIESRLIQQVTENEWDLRHGPLEESVFSTLPDSHWTLLVQDVDKHIPEVAHLLDAFDFLPDWRIDDIMISYATDEGGVGPHTDNYDVFLVQTQGQRRWRLSEREYRDEDLLADCPLRVLKEFSTDEDWVLNPGDVLYLPPRLAHWGTAVGECMTWSIGMRGPSQHELLDAWLQYRAETHPTTHFRDSLSSPRQPAAQVTQQEFDAARTLMQDLLPLDTPEFQRWFGGYVTEPKPGFEIAPLEQPIEAAELKTSVKAGRALHRHPWARIACVDLHNQGLALCSQGQCFPLPRDLSNGLDLVASNRHLEPDHLLAIEPQTPFWQWLAQLANHGILELDD